LTWVDLTRQHKSRSHTLINGMEIKI
jgi:hypothetical protein